MHGLPSAGVDLSGLFELGHAADRLIGDASGVHSPNDRSDPVSGHGLADTNGPLARQGDRVLIRLTAITNTEALNQEI
jgi:hypothetical protein